MQKIVREPSLIEIEYITKVLTDNNVNVENVIVHSVTEELKTEYDIEIYHDGLHTRFSGDKSEIDELILQEYSPSREEMLACIKKAAHDCKVLNKYYNNYYPFFYRWKDSDISLLIKPGLLSIHTGFIRLSGNDNSIDVKSIISVHTYNNNYYNNHNKRSYILDKTVRLVHDDEYYKVNNEDIDIKYFDGTYDDYFALSTLYSISKECHNFLLDVNKALESSKYTKYKINFNDDNRVKSNNCSYYNKAVKEYMNIDIEKLILDQIEKEYADCIQIP